MGPVTVVIEPLTASMDPQSSFRTHASHKEYSGRGVYYFIIPFFFVVVCFYCIQNNLQNTGLNNAKEKVHLHLKYHQVSNFNSNCQCCLWKTETMSHKTDGKILARSFHRQKLQQILQSIFSPVKMYWMIIQTSDCDLVSWPHGFILADGD